MRIALAQINPCLGFFKKNAEKIIEFAVAAKERRCDIVLFPESTLFGYHPMDLLQRKSVVEEQLKYLSYIQKHIPKNLLVVFGAFTKNPSKKGKPFFNSAIAFEKGKKPWMCHKELLPTYDVFDDARHIEPGDLKKNILIFKGKKILITICEDIWAWPMSKTSNRQDSYYDKNPIKKIKPNTVDLVLNLSASPFFTHKVQQRRTVASEVVRYLKAPLVYVNMVGAQDELIFDGGSFALSHKGDLMAQCLQFNEDIGVVDFDKNKGTIQQLEMRHTETLRQALVLGIRDFVQKSGQSRVHFGLSGGIDSALVACLAVDALGVQNVSAFALPGPYSSGKSLILAKRLAKNLGIEFKTIDFKNLYKSTVSLIDKKVGRTQFGFMHENIQARLRGLLLMAMSNRNQSMLLNTSNKSEFAAGYGTLYGDMAGGLSPIGDLLKSDVYRLCELYNSDFEFIPKEILKRAPTAELRPNQKDQDSLPPYSELDKSVINIVEKAKKPRTKADTFLLSALMKSEFKRWQSPPILKVREHSFGQGRRMPIAHKGYF